MILFFAPFPDPSKGDGWMDRILDVDEIFRDRARVYVYGERPYGGAAQPGYDYYYKKHDELREEYVLNFRFARHQRVLTELVEQADFVYAHTCHSAQYMLSYYPTGKIVTDLHGLASLEEEMLGFAERARFFGALEEPMIRGSAALIAVTRIMADYFRDLYPGLRTGFILNPIRHDLPELSETELIRPSADRPTAVFAGGFQKWQQPEKMLRLSAEMAGRCDFRFYSGADAAYRRLKAALNLPEESSTVAFLPKAELGAAYRSADFGLVLREDSPVNRAACPTKLMEYMAYGLIPVVELYEIGDFAAAGYQALRLDDFRAGRQPDGETLNRMRLANARLVCHFTRQRERGIAELRALAAPEPALDMKSNAALFLSTTERMRQARKICRLRYRLPGQAEESEMEFRDLMHFDCPVLRFPLAGGLESLSLRLLDAPFIVKPFQGRIRLRAGSCLTIELERNYESDKYGNWVFGRDSWFRFAVKEPLTDPLYLEIDLEIMLFDYEMNAGPA